MMGEGRCCTPQYTNTGPIYFPHPLAITPVKSRRSPKWGRATEVFGLPSSVLSFWSSVFTLSFVIRGHDHTTIFAHIGGHRDMQRMHLIIL